MSAVAARGRAKPRTAVVLCEDLGDAQTPLDLRRLADHISAIDDVDVSMPGRVCSDFAALVQPPPRATAVVVCRNGHELREEITSRLHQAGLRFDAIDVVGAATAADASVNAAESAIALAVHAAIAGIDAEPYPMSSAERRINARRPMSRRTAMSPAGGGRVAMPAPSRSVCVPSTGCRLCVERCPEAVISIGPEGPVIDADRCTGCGACVAACPLAAWRLPGFSTRQLAARLDALLRPGDLPAAEGIVVRCARARAEGLLGSGWAELSVPSLVVVGPGAVMTAMLAGARTVRLVPCDDAHCRDAAAGLDDLVGRIGLRSRPLPVRVEVREPDATLAALEVLPRTDVRAASAFAPLGDVHLDADKCTGCEACFSACPTSALSVHADDGWSLSFDPRRCVGCGLCARSCPEEAMAVDRVVDTALLSRGDVVLARRPQQQCPRCGRPMYDAAIRRAVAARLAPLAPAAAELTGATCGHCGPTDLGVDLPAGSLPPATARRAPH